MMSLFEIVRGLLSSPSHPGTKILEIRALAGDKFMISIDRDGEIVNKEITAFTAEEVEQIDELQEAAYH
ncbi:hypothetical protein [Larkinella sp.]|uniref:hypothetical protein n=1 Tax=Larkinella sp. TaxID=2034517 RepID=UPI003BAACAB5